MQATLIMEGGFFMATTRLMPLHTGKGRTVGTAISTSSTMFKIRRKQTTAGSLPAINVTAGLRMQSSFSINGSTSPPPAGYGARTM